jgi:hypothetical protein
LSNTLDIKIEVASQLGKTNGNVPEIKRDTAIVRARRAFYGAFPWSRLKNSDVLTFASGVVAWPIDFDATFPPHIYTYSASLKVPYRLVAIEDVSGYTLDVPVFAVDFANSQFISNVDGDVNITYQTQVSDTLSDSFVEPTDDISPIVSLAIGYYWLSAERKAEQYDRFTAVYKQELADCIRQDRLKQPTRHFVKDGSDYGYGEGQFYSRNGYIGRG